MPFAPYFFTGGKQKGQQRITSQWRVFQKTTPREPMCYKRKDDCGHLCLIFQATGNKCGQAVGGLQTMATTAQRSQEGNTIVAMHTENIGLGFAARDSLAREKEATREISFLIIRNDQQNQTHLRFLLDLKNIFARQLPKMPKEYIVKLVFDRHHESMVILRDGVKVVGGITFRLFPQQRFAEIAFLAITSSEQIRGFGTRLMNKLKEEMQRRKVQFLMTYADNLALGYFRKQGFSRQHRMPVERWRGYIKDYQGGTMMECHVHPLIDYAQISTIIRRQKEFVLQRIKELSTNDHRYSGAALKELIGEPLIRVNHMGVEEKFKIDPMQIPGVQESGWSWKEHEELIKTKKVSFVLECQNLLELLKKHPSSWPFRDPVSLEDVPDYGLIVKEPIDLKTIEKKLGASQYEDKQRFVEDILRVCSNSRLYNQPETVYYKCANELEEYARPHIEALYKGELLLDKRASKTKSKDKKKKVNGE